MESTLILIRHGQSVWNAENRFTGWIDVPLAAKGWQEAQQAGIRLTEISFDAAYTSHLQRAICTLNMVLRENQAGRTPIFMPAEGTTPRENYELRDHEFPVHHNVVALAERHYGDLQGLNKDEVRDKFGEEQFKKWRRGYDTPPPHGESLKDTCERVMPYFNREIRPRLIAGQTILIAAHGNSLRALTKELEQLSDEAIVSYEIPTGIPIVYRLQADTQKIVVTEKTVLD
jgi:2,3-bisphosphoglycerate-dependent phosphoglycerate mutase